MKKIISIVLAFTMVFTLFAGSQMAVSAYDDTAEAIVTIAESTPDTSDSEEVVDPSEPTEPSDPTEPSEPTVPSEEEFSSWIAEIIAKVLAILAKICEVLFDNIIW